MDGLTLLRRAHQAGLAVESEGDRLVIRGPKRAEAVARLLIDHKLDVLTALAPQAACEETARNRSTAVRVTWRDRHALRIVHWFRGGRPWEEAERLAFGEMILEWHRRHGERVRPGCWPPAVTTCPPAWGCRSIKTAPESI